MPNNFSSITENADRMRRELDSLKTAGNLRTLKSIVPAGRYIVYENKRYMNFSANDYLGLSETELAKQFFEEILCPAEERGEFLFSNPASRLMTGNSVHYDALENSLGALYGNRKALVLSSGFLVNAGILPALAHKGDLILADKLIHASVIEGLRLGEADWKRFRHNDIEHLEALLKTASGRTVWVVTESIFSMDGDIAPLREIVALKEKYGFNLYVDEAHAFGIVGSNGAGVAMQMGIADKCDIIVGTFGKAVSSAGAFVITDSLTREYLINKMRTLIFSTALPPLTLMWTRWVIEHFTEMEARRKHLENLWKLLANDLGVSASSHIIPLHAGTNERAIAMAEAGKAAGYWLTPIRHPTVPAGTARIRLSLSAAMTECDIKNFCNTWKNIG